MTQIGNPERDEFVKPIKKYQDRMKFKNYWLHSSNKYIQNVGMRNWTLFKLGIVTGLRASDIISLKYNQVYNPKNDEPRTHIIGEHDKKTGKSNPFLDIEPIKSLLLMYRNWLHKRYDFKPVYMFPNSIRVRDGHLSVNALYKLLRKAGDRLGIPNVGSHSLRKTCGYIAYQQTHNILYVMKKLNQTNPQVTLRYIDVDQASMDKITNSINWN